MITLLVIFSLFVTVSFADCADNLGNVFPKDSYMATHDCTRCYCDRDSVTRCTDIACRNGGVFSPTCPVKPAVVGICAVPPDSCSQDIDCAFSFDESVKQLCCSDGCNKRCTTPGDSRPLIPAGSPCLDFLSAIRTQYRGGIPPTREILLRLDRIRQDGSINFVANNCSNYQFPEMYEIPTPPPPKKVTPLPPPPPPPPPPFVGGSFFRSFAEGENSNTLRENSSQNDVTWPGWVVAPIVILSLGIVALVLVNVKLWRILSQNS